VIGKEKVERKRIENKMIFSLFNWEKMEEEKKNEIRVLCGFVPFYCYL